MRILILRQKLKKQSKILTLKKNLVKSCRAKKNRRVMAIGTKPSFKDYTYRKVANSNTSRFEAHAGLFRFSMLMYCDLLAKTLFFN